MSRFFSTRHAALVPYTPGEQPRDRQFVKLNTNESPYPPAPAVWAAAERESRALQLYSDPECTALRAAAAKVYDVAPENLLAVNGSDEALSFAFLAFCDETHPMAFPDITYGFYPVFAAIHRVPTHVIPVDGNLQIRPEDYAGLGENLVLANPNAPTGQLLTPAEIETIARSNPDRVVIVDEAYIDFGGESCVPLTKELDNLLVIQTFSKSRSMAGARLGFAIGNEALIRDLNTIKYSTNPYNVNRMTQAAGAAALEENEYYMANCRQIAATRDKTAAGLEELGFSVLPSAANFLFARREGMGGGEFYRALRNRGVLVRWFDQPRIRDYVRVTVGSPEQMEIFLTETRAILNERSERP